jgi:tetratricopeptide (TPR) repeat protein
MPPIDTASTPAAGSARRVRIHVLAACALLVGSAVVLADWWTCLPADTQATFVGSQSCIECHQDYYDQWKGSHHDLAMDRATPETVLGDFDDVQFEHFGIRSRMFRRDGKYMVHTEGPDGQMADFEVQYVFGVTPLQQYMVEFDRPADMQENEIARLQVLRICWDTERQEWFYLPPPDVRDEKLAPNDELHWTGVAQRWNNMCADCHSTNLQKNFDVATKTYHTTFSEIDVSCEACHGPGSVHNELARQNSLFWDRKLGYGLARLKDSQEAQIQSCAPCHSRRRHVHPGFQPGDNYYDCFDNELLGRDTYHADGQILDEVYVYSSFVQSKMYHNDIRCSDCHDVHTTRLKYPGNQVCTSCHQHPAGKYDSPSHHHHQPGSTGSLCAECHMPETTYMEVDPRRDHSIRNPRPDLSVRLGTPNACTRCHLDKEQAGFADRDDLRQYLDWILAARNGDQAVAAELARVDQEMVEACEEWYADQRQEPLRPDKHFATAIDAARRGDPTAADDLIRVATDGRVPAIVRATALRELGQFDARRNVAAAVELLQDASPQVRATAIGNLQGRLSEDELAKRLAPLLGDPIRLVRTEAARVLATIPGGSLRGTQRQQLRDALTEYKAGLMVSNDRAAAHMTLGIVHESLGEDQEAIEAYRAALHVEPQVSGPRTNLAAVYDRQAEAAGQRAQQAEMLGNQASYERAVAEIKQYRDEAARLRREELDCLARDASLVPDSAAVQYRYGMLLYLHRRLDDAETALRKAVELEPNTPQFLLGLTLFYQQVEKFDLALPLAERLVALRPEDRMYRQVLAEIQNAARLGPKTVRPQD